MTSKYKTLAEREQENRDLQLKQTRSINTALKKVRTLSRVSQQFAPLSVLANKDPIPKNDRPPVPVSSHEPFAGVYMSSTAHVDDISRRTDDTSSFCITEPSEEEDLASTLQRALHIVKQEQKQFRSSSLSRVVRRWRIL